MPPFDTSRRAEENDSRPSGSDYIVKNVLLTVKAYPLPSNKYDETVCVAGITSDGEWIRIYPFEWFSIPEEKRPKKYQWFSVPVKSRAPQDNRPESNKPKIEHLELGTFLDTTVSGWRLRNQIVMPMVSRSVEEMKQNGLSLALIKPRNKPELIIEPDSETWGARREAMMNQMRMFQRQRIQLRKVPWKFSYKFRCSDDTCNRAHKLSILDWEIFRLYENLVRSYGGFAIDRVLQDMEDRWITRMWNDTKDPHIYIGTTLRFNSPIVLGVYSPPLLSNPGQTILV